MDITRNLIARSCRRRTRLSLVPRPLIAVVSSRSPLRTLSYISSISVSVAVAVVPRRLSLPLALSLRLNSPRPLRPRRFGRDRSLVLFASANNAVSRRRFASVGAPTLRRRRSLPTGWALPPRRAPSPDRGHRTVASFTRHQRFEDDDEELTGIH